MVVDTMYLFGGGENMGSALLVVKQKNILVKKKQTLYYVGLTVCQPGRLQDFFSDSELATV